MIEDIEGGSRGALIDWEFAMRITADNMYPTGGTVSGMHLFDVRVLTYIQGTIPFMSVHGIPH